MVQAQGSPLRWAMYDWMHVYIVGGIFNNEVGMLLGMLQTSMRLSHVQIHEFVSSFKWPQRLDSRASGRNVFQKRSKDAKHEPLKCSASEALSVFSVFRHFLLVEVMPRACAHVKAACTSYISLCDVLEQLLRIPRGTASPASVRTAVQTHLRRFRAVYGEDAFVPKCHMAMHLADMFEQHGLLISCFVHERKHKEIKRYANELDITNASFEKSVLKDVLYMHVEALKEPSIYTSSTAHLVPPVSQASQKLRDVVQRELGTVSPIHTARCAAGHYGLRCSAGDVAIMQVGGEVRVSEVWFHVRVDGVCITCCSPWNALGAGGRFQVVSEPVLARTECILDTCTYRRQGDTAVVIPPVHMPM